MMKGGKLFITGRAKEIIFVNGQNYYPHDIESIAIRAEGLELGKVVAAGVRPKGASTDDLILFVLHRMDMKEFLPQATQVTRLVNEHTGLEVAHVVPVKRIPKTTSGKIQRHLLEDGLRERRVCRGARRTRQRCARRPEAAGGVKITSTEIERRIKDICDAALERNIDVNDNLFEIGASSLKLIEIHEQIDRAWPGLVDLTELFDFPTISELSASPRRQVGRDGLIGALGLGLRIGGLVRRAVGIHRRGQQQRQRHEDGKGGTVEGEHGFWLHQVG